MNRFTEKRNGKNVIPLRNAVCGVDMPRWKLARKSDLEAFLSGEAVDRLAEYEDAVEQGRLVVLPCRVGDTVYYLTGNPSMVSGRNFNRVESTSAIGFYWDEKGLQICLYMPHGNHGTYGYFGDTIFLTREEAEAVLNEKMEADES